MGFRAAKVAAGWFKPATSETFNGRTPQAWVDVECEKLQTIRKHIGNEFTVSLDGHISNAMNDKMTPWDVGIAKAVLKAMEPYDIFFMRSL